jgi:hypothetical protein
MERSRKKSVSPDCRCPCYFGRVTARRLRVARRLAAIGRPALLGVWVAVASLAGCDVNTALEHIAEARRLSADLLIQFTRSAASSNRAVMADTDELSAAFARESAEARAAVEKDRDALVPLLEELRFADEVAMLSEFRARFAEYQALDRTILELAVQNTNLKARQLSYGAAQERADEFADALRSIGAAPGDAWRAKALAASALASLREIQVIQAPHIAEPDDQDMTRFEARMAQAEQAARESLAGLAPVVSPASRPALARATRAFDQFLEIHKQIVTYSRQNTNVRSLALTLNEKAKLQAACESTLRTLRDALSRRGLTGTR